MLFAIWILANRFLFSFCFFSNSFVDDFLSICLFFCCPLRKYVSSTLLYYYYCFVAAVLATGIDWKMYIFIDRVEPLCTNGTHCQWMFALNKMTHWWPRPIHHKQKQKQLHQPILERCEIYLLSNVSYVVLWLCARCADVRCACVNWTYLIGK